MRFERLSIAGFKSFADPVEVEILPGLTGIVGPNGCGKSNVVEALRWVMGTASAKALRAGGMEDVVFGGTESAAPAKKGRRGRSARRWAEVTLSLANEGRAGPEAFRDQPTLEVSRRIVRGADGTNSTYRVNGREVRARDVQILFADTGSGANSPALVRQGQINEIIAAKPEQRRRLLEEAAGITGLHARRHEAELRLRAAAQNLERLDDALGGLEARRATLARQARAALRYRDLSEALRRAEALVTWRRWRAAQDAATAASEALKEAESEARAGRAAAEAADEALRAANASLPARHREEAEAATALAEARSAAARTAEEVRQAESVVARLREASERVAADLARETALRDEARDVRSRQAEELAALSGAEDEAPDALDAGAETARRALDEAEEAARAARAAAAEAERTSSLARARAEGAARDAARLHRERGEVSAALTALPEEDDEADTLLRLRDEAAAALADAEQAAASAEAARASAEAAARAADAPRLEAARRAGELDAERAALARVLSADAPAEGAMIDRIRTEEGYEAALAAALGDALTASEDRSTDRFWREGAQADAGALPGDAVPLADMTEAPDVLRPALSAIGVVPDADGAGLIGDLRPGQCLVSREGGLWRWDGYVRHAGAETAAAARLAQRRRLEAVEREARAAQDDAARAQARSEAAASEARRAQEAEKAARSQLRDARMTLTRTDEQLRGAEARRAATGAKREALSARLAPLMRALAEAEDAQSQADEALKSVDPSPARHAAEAAETQLRGAREDEQSAREAAARHRREVETRQRRARDLRETSADWARREAGAAERVASLDKVRADLARQLTEAEAVPAALRDRAAAGGRAATEAEARREAARVGLRAAEAETREAEEERRRAEARAAEAGEARGRQQALAEAAARDAKAATEAARHAAGGEPDRLLVLAAPDGEPPALAEAEAARDDLAARRERLGAVNLVAERELKELSEELDAMLAERGDCEAAVAKLRAAVASLSRDGRARLREAFDAVNEQFGALFEQLFGGGDARLELTGDDLLEAGLEVLASPPGKKLSSLSLMSGGEQALTATALIFAVFLARPAPICVLDEVDAPLDDANVDRFCGLLRAMTERTQTRFLVVTHHPLTMSRMDRLYGVTMGEPGVSRLVSVDLQAAEEMAA